MGHKERPVKEGIPMGLLDLLLVAVWVINGRFRCFGL